MWKWKGTFLSTLQPKPPSRPDVEEVILVPTDEGTGEERTEQQSSSEDTQLPFEEGGDKEHPEDKQGKDAEESLEQHPTQATPVVSPLPPNGGNEDVGMQARESVKASALHRRPVNSCSSRMFTSNFTAPHHFCRHIWENNLALAWAIAPTNNIWQGTVLLWPHVLCSVKIWKFLTYKLLFVVTISLILYVAIAPQGCDACIKCSEYIGRASKWRVAC